jgi:hypothetical protein
MRITRRKFFAALAGLFAGGLGALGARAQKPVFYPMDLGATRMCDGVVKIQTDELSFPVTDEMLPDPTADFYELYARCNRAIMDQFYLPPELLGVPRGTPRVGSRPYTGARARGILPGKWDERP